MNKEYEIIRLKLEDSNRPIQYFTEDFYEKYLEYRRGTGEIGDYANPTYYDKVRGTDFFTKTPAAYSEFVRIYHDRLPKYCIDFKESPSSCCIKKRMVERLEDAEYAKNFAKRWSVYFGNYYEISKVA